MKRGIGLFSGIVTLGGIATLGLGSAYSQTVPAPVPAPAPAPASVPGGAIAAYFDQWAARVATARASQPDWSSPLVTTTALLEQRMRFDTQFQTAGNGTSTVNTDGGKGLDLIVSDTQEVQVASPPYVIRSAQSRKSELAGFGDWAVVRFKQRLASGGATEGDYVVSAWLQVQAPTGIARLTSNATTLLPTLGFGKAWGNFVIQGTVGAVIPTDYEASLGTQVVANAALQYRVARLFWPQMEVNWTCYPDGQRGGENQVFLAPGLVVGRLPLTDRLRATVGVGYQFAVAPAYRASPLMPAYDHAWLTTVRVSF